jgi:alanine racemase
MTVTAGTRAATAHRAWIEVDHAAIAHNLQVIRELALPHQGVIGVVKANAYGHGDVAVSRTLERHGVDWLAVTTLDEGLRLRSAGIRARIIVLWELTGAEAPEAVAAHLEATLFSPRGVSALDAAAREAGRRVAVHLKVDSGLGRQGVAPSEAAALGLDIARRAGLRLASTYTHLAVPGEDEAYTEVQLAAFARALDAMRSAGVDPGLVHVAATGGLLAGLARFADAVRPGLAIYGMLPAWATDDPGFVPALSLHALPVRIFDVPAGGAVGYGLRFRTDTPARIATLPIGYGDGWPRVHANNGWAIVRGTRAPIVGAVSMDGLTVDVSRIDDVTLDDEFVLIGGQASERITADEVAEQRRTINYEVTTSLRERLPRIAVAG